MARSPRLGLAALSAVAMGVIVCQSGLVSLLQAAGLAGWGFLTAMGLAALLMAANAAAFAELALMMPRAGGLGAYCEAALGPWAAVVAVFAGYVVPALFGPAAELLLVGQVVADLGGPHIPPLAWAVGLLGVLLGLNLRGTDVFARVQTGQIGRAHV